MFLRILFKTFKIVHNLIYIYLERERQLFFGILICFKDLLYILYYDDANHFKCYSSNIIVKSKVSHNYILQAFGGSAAQSATLQVLDALLGIQHTDGT